LVAFFLSTEAEQPEQQRRLLALFWAGIGLAFLAKGLVAFILTLGTVGLYALARRRKLQVGLLWGLPLALLVSAVWYGPVTYRNGWTFINEFFVQHHFQRYLSDKYKHSQPPYFYLVILPLLALPWTPVLIAALVRLKKTGLRFDSAEARLQVFGLCWMLVPLGFFSLSGSKLPDYVLPSLPGIGLLCAPIVAEWAKSRKWSTIFAVLGFGMLCLRPAFAVWGPGLPTLEEDGVKRLLAQARTSGDGNLALVEYKVTQRTPQFYAAGQLLYDRKENDLMRADSPEELAALVSKQPLLVLVQTKDAADLDSPKLSVKPIGIDSKFTIVRVQAVK
jgi:4-amino-4-deoxy-L-arabinose transferase-like glycosyltransferase